MIYLVKIHIRSMKTP